MSLNFLAKLYEEIGNPAKSASLNERALTIWETTLGPNNPQTTSTLVSSRCLTGPWETTLTPNHGSSVL